MVVIPGQSALAASCSNEALREALGSVRLPECRAYELVSPTVKNGSLVKLVSAEGSHVIMSSLGAFAGSDQEVLQGYFDTERKETESAHGGWNTLPFSEPSGFENAISENVADLDSSLQEGLFVYRFPSAISLSERSFYVRAIPGGTPREVGPIFAGTVIASSPASYDETISTPSVSADLGTVLFMIAGQQSATRGIANYLWPGDTTVENTGPLDSGLGFTSLYEYTGIDNTAPTLVGVDNNGRQISQCGTALGFPDGGIFSKLDEAYDTYNSISLNGGRVFFTAAGATQGPSHDTCTGAGSGYGPAADELFARTNNSETTAISLPTAGVGGDCAMCNAGEPKGAIDGSIGEGAIFQGASQDGSKVFFETTWPLLKSDNDHTLDLYEYDFDAMPGQKIIQVSAGDASDPTRGSGAQVQGVVRVSEDGSHVYFVARGLLTTKPGPNGRTAVAGADNMYVFDTETEETSFVGDLCSNAEMSGTVPDPACPSDLNALLPGEPKSMNDLSLWQLEDSRPVQATPDGRNLVFTSDAELTPDDTSSSSQAFEYDATTGTLVRVSVGENGFNNNGNSQEPENGARIVVSHYNANQDPAPQLSAVSEDGSIVVFESRDALTLHAAAGYPNVYEYHAGQVNLISDGQDRSFGEGGSPSTSLLGIDGSGADIFFTTADQLVPQDGDSQTDIYDARVDGGFSPPPASPECESEGCQGGLASPLSFSPAASVGQPAGENVVEPPVSDATKTKPALVKKRANTKRKRKSKAVRANRAPRRKTSRNARDTGRARGLRK